MRLTYLLAFVGVFAGIVFGIVMRGEGTPPGPYPQLPPGQSAFGGPFQLIDHHGQVFTDKDLRGTYALLYFGYTDCPDACPTTLLLVAEALKKLDAQSDRIRPVFVNVDPKVTSTERLAGYVAFFHPRLLGLTGTPEQIEQVKKAYRVYFADAMLDGERVISHTSYLFLLAPDGNVLTYFRPGMEAEDLARALRVYTRTGAR